MNIQSNFTLRNHEPQTQELPPLDSTSLHEEMNPPTTKATQNLYRTFYAVKSQSDTSKPLGIIAWFFKAIAHLAKQGTMSRPKNYTQASMVALNKQDTSMISSLIRHEIQSANDLKHGVLAAAQQVSHYVASRPDIQH